MDSDILLHKAIIHRSCLRINLFKRGKLLSFSGTIFCFRGTRREKERTSDTVAKVIRGSLQNACQDSSISLGHWQET